MNRLLGSGAFAGPLLMITVLIDGATRPGYSTTRHGVSQLGLGERGWLTQLAFIISGALFAAFAVALFRLVRSASFGTVWQQLLPVVDQFGSVELRRSGLRRTRTRLCDDIIDDGSHHKSRHHSVILHWRGVLGVGYCHGPSGSNRSGIGLAAARLPPVPSCSPLGREADRRSFAIEPSQRLLPQATGLPTQGGRLVRTEGHAVHFRSSLTIGQQPTGHTSDDSRVRQYH
jgi:hypothetical protein